MLRQRGEEFRSLLSRSGYSRKDIARKYLVTERTVSNWLRTGCPPMLTELLQMAAGDHEDWLGYKIRNGIMYCPNLEMVTKEQIEMYHWTNLHLHRELLRNKDLQESARRIIALGKSSNQNQDSNFVELAKLMVG